MIYWPLSNLLAADIKRIFVVTGGEHFDSVGRLLGSGKKLKETLGIDEVIDDIAFGVQDKAGGIAEALGLARGFVGNDSVAVILGDNIYEKEDFLEDPIDNFLGRYRAQGAHIFLKEVPDEQLYEEVGEGKKKAKFGIAELEREYKDPRFNRNEPENHVIKIAEKPEEAATNYAVTGAYVYDNGVFRIIDQLKPSGRGELEITDVNTAYIKSGRMRFSMVEGEWTDAGSRDTLVHANQLAKKWNRAGHGFKKGVQDIPF